MGWLPGSGCKLWLQFDERRGNTAYDLSGYGNHGTIYGASFRRGKIGYALEFGGVDDYVDVAENIDLNPHTSDWSVEAWVKPISLTRGIYRNSGNYGFVVESKRHVSTDNSLTLLMHYGTSETSDAKWAFVWDGPSQAAGAESDFFPPGRWYHLVGVRDGGNLYIYVNGKVYGPNNFLFAGSQISETTDIDSTSPIHLAHHGAWGIYSNGIIDEFRECNRVLTKKEGTSHYWYGIVPALRQRELVRV